MHAIWHEGGHNTLDVWLDLTQCDIFPSSWPLSAAAPFYHSWKKPNNQQTFSVFYFPLVFIDFTVSCRITL